MRFIRRAGKIIPIKSAVSSAKEKRIKKEIIEYASTLKHLKSPTLIENFNRKISDLQESLIILKNKKLKNEL